MVLFTRDSNTPSKTSLPLPAFFPLTAQDKVIFRTYSGVAAVATRDHTVHGALVRAGDLRPSLETRYASRDAWATRLAEATDCLVAERLLLAEDGDRLWLCRSAADQHHQNQQPHAHRPNENKMSDGHRGRALLEVRMV